MSEDYEAQADYWNERARGKEAQKDHDSYVDMKKRAEEAEFNLAEEKKAREKAEHPWRSEELIDANWQPCPHTPEHFYGFNCMAERWKAAEANLSAMAEKLEESEKVSSRWESRAKRDHGDLACSLEKSRLLLEYMSAQRKTTEQKAAALKDLLEESSCGCQWDESIENHPTDCDFLKRKKEAIADE